MEQGAQVGAAGGSPTTGSDMLELDRPTSVAGPATARKILEAMATHPSAVRVGCWAGAITKFKLWEFGLPLCPDRGMYLLL